MGVGFINNPFETKYSKGQYCALELTDFKYVYELRHVYSNYLFLMHFLKKNKNDCVLYEYKDKDKYIIRSKKEIDDLEFCIRSEYKGIDNKMLIKKDKPKLIHALGFE